MRGSWIQGLRARKSSPSASGLRFIRVHPKQIRVHPKQIRVHPKHWVQPKQRSTGRPSPFRALRNTGVGATRQAFTIRVLYSRPVYVGTAVAERHDKTAAAVVSDGAVSYLVGRPLRGLAVIMVYVVRG